MNKLNRLIDQWIMVIWVSSFVLLGCNMDEPLVLPITRILNQVGHLL